MGQPVMLPNGAVVDSRRLPPGSLLEAPVHVTEGSMLESIRTAPGTARTRGGSFSGGRLRHSSSSHSRTSSQAQYHSPESYSGSPAHRRISDLSETSLQGGHESVSDSLGSIVDAKTVESPQTSLQDYIVDSGGVQSRISDWEQRDGTEETISQSQDPSSQQRYSSESTPHSVHYHPITVPDSTVQETMTLTGTFIIPGWVHCHVALRCNMDSLLKPSSLIALFLFTNPHLHSRSQQPLKDGSHLSKPTNFTAGDDDVTEQSLPRVLICICLSCLYSNCCYVFLLQPAQHSVGMCRFCWGASHACKWPGGRFHGSSPECGAGACSSSLS